LTAFRYSGFNCSRHPARAPRATRHARDAAVSTTPYAKGSGGNNLTIVANPDGSL
jgi:hypothetical protein